MVGSEVSLYQPVAKTILLEYIGKNLVQYPSSYKSIIITITATSN